MKSLPVALLVLALAPAPEVRAQVTLTQVANEGFLLAAGERKVLIDALLDQGLAGYGRVPDEMRPALEGAKRPFDGVDLLLVSHFHDDHFGPQAILRHLDANPAAHLLAPPQAIERLRREARLPLHLTDRIEKILPARGEIVSLERNEIQVQVLNLHHGRRSPPVVNLGFILDLGGVRLLHVGDTEATASELRDLGLAESGIDIALLPTWFLTDPDLVAVIREEIRPGEIVVMHLAEPEAPPAWFWPGGSRQELVDAILESFPEAILLPQGDSLSLSPRR